MHINDELEVTSVWYYVNEKGSGNQYQRLYNHHAITKYMIKEGFDV